MATTVEFGVHLADPVDAVVVLVDLLDQVRSP
jgi:hypothetical protein